MSFNFWKVVFGLSSPIVNCNMSCIHKQLATKNACPFIFFLSFFLFIQICRYSISHSYLSWITSIPTVLTMLRIIEKYAYVKSYAVVYCSACSYSSFMDSYSSFRLFSWEFPQHIYLSTGTAYMLRLNHNATCIATLTSARTSRTAVLHGQGMQLDGVEVCRARRPFFCQRYFSYK
jgi:hypothetical protein